MKITQTIRPAIYLIILLVIAAGFCLCRSATDFVWDDSPHLVANRFDVVQPLLWGQDNLLQNIWTKSLSELTKTGYIPLRALIDNFGKINIH